MADSQKLLGLRIKEVRNRNKVSQASLAERVGIDPKHLSRIEVGKSSPSMKTLGKLSDELDVEIKELFEFHHLNPNPEDIMKDIHTLLEKAGPEDLRKFLKLLKSISH